MSTIKLLEGCINRIIAKNNVYWMQYTRMMHTTTYAQKMHKNHPTTYPKPVHVAIKQILHIMGY